MSSKKMQSLVGDMIHKAPMAQWEMAKKIGAMFIMQYSELVSIKKSIPAKKKNPFFSRIAKKNFGKRIKPRESRF